MRKTRTTADGNPVDFPEFVVCYSNKGGFTAYSHGVECCSRTHVTARSAADHRARQLIESAILEWDNPEPGSYAEAARRGPTYAQEWVNRSDHKPPALSIHRHGDSRLVVRHTLRGVGASDAMMRTPAICGSTEGVPLGPRLEREAAHAMWVHKRNVVMQSARRPTETMKRTDSEYCEGA